MAERQTQALMTKDISEALKAAGTDPNEFSIDPEKQMKLAEFLQSSFFEPRAAHGMVPSLVGTIKDLKDFHVPVTQLLRCLLRGIICHPNPSICPLQVLDLWMTCIFPEQVRTEAVRGQVLRAAEGEMASAAHHGGLPRRARME